MLLAALLLLLPSPQTGEAVKPTVESAAVVSIQESQDTKNSGTMAALPSTPEPKIQTDAEEEAAANSSPIAPHSNLHPIEMVHPATNKQSYETPRQRKIWYALTFATSGTAGFDAWSTRRAISQGYGTEANPLLRPFANSGALYAVTQVVPLAMDYVGKRMMVSDHHWMRRMWWVPQSASAMMSLGAGAHNMTVAP